MKKISKYLSFYFFLSFSLVVHSSLFLLLGMGNSANRIKRPKQAPISFRVIEKKLTMIEQNAKETAPPKDTNNIGWKDVASRDKTPKKMDSSLYREILRGSLKILKEEDSKKQDESSGISTKRFRHFGYLLKFSSAISTNWYESNFSKFSSIRGVVLVRIVLERSGKISDAFVLETSGSRHLDQKALDNVMSFGFFDPFPEAWEVDRISFDKQFAYY